MASFREEVESNKGCAVILAGSGSDEKHIDEIVKSLRMYEVPLEVRVKSAHKQGEDLPDLLELYDSMKGGLAYIVVAGGVDALSGTSSFQSWRPTISCPPEYPKINESCLRNPLGSSNAYIRRPEDVGRLVAQIFAHQNPTYREKLISGIKAKKEKLKEDDAKLRAKYSWVGV